MLVTRRSRSISHIGTIFVAAVIVIIASGGAYLANTMMQSTVTSSSVVNNNTMIPYTGSASSTTTISSSTVTRIGSTSEVINYTNTITLQTSNTSTSNSSTFTTTSTSISTRSVSPGGLVIRLILNSSRITSGASIGINVSDYNTFPMELNLSEASDWALNGLATGGCPSLYLPFGIAVFQGTYTSANVSQATPLPIFQVVACPMLVRFITGYLFQPMSDNATVLPGTEVTPMATVVPVNGIYNYTGIKLNQLIPFSPGTYTVVAGDEWGNLAFAYFVVM